jgi:diguanylate cyclase (GGDEF)-like protein
MSSPNRVITLPAGRRLSGASRGSKGARPSSPKLSRVVHTPAVTLEDFAVRLRRSHGALRNRVERRHALVDMIRGVNATMEPGQIGQFLVQRACNWLPAPCVVVLSIDSSEQLTVLAERGLDADLGPAVYASAAWVIQRGEQFITADVRGEGRISAEGTGTVVAFPLACRSRTVGALIAVDRQPSTRAPRLSPSVREGIGVLLEPVAAALDSALLLKRAEALSVTDDLTHLYNLRYLNQVLRREVKRSARSGHPLSLLFIDLDGFKSVNDAHGHLSGSRALVEASSVIRGSARETDVVARYGGDEFALVLPDTGAAGALAVGERIRERLADHTFLMDQGLAVHLTASVGIATRPDAADSPEELMRAADSAMYLVKDRGKNGICAARGPSAE